MTNPNFTATLSTNELYYDLNTTICLTDMLDEYGADIDALQAAIEGGTGGDYAPADHTHDEYALTTEVTALQDALANKANSDHTHTGYAASSHTHSEYVTQNALDALEAEVDGKADSAHTHADYASVSHVHDNYSAVGHDHDEDYAAISHSHSDYATTTALSELSATVSGKANASHAHDDRYYTESEVDSKLATKSDTSHNHDGVYDAAGAAASALTSANAYTDAEIANLLNNSTTAVDSIMELAEAMEDNADAITALESVAAGKANASHTHAIADVANLQASLDSKAAASHSHNDVYYTESEIDEKLSGKSDSGHTHDYAASSHEHSQYATVDNLSALETIVSGKAASSHNHDDRYYTESEIDSKLDDKADANHTHDYASSTHTHSQYATVDALDELEEIVSGKAASSHSHAIANVTNLQSALDSKASSSHNHDSAYDAKGSASAALTSANAYTDEQIESLDYAASSHSHTIANVSNLQSELDALESAISGKADASHTHTVDTALSGTSTNPVQNKVINSALAGKANTSHGNHVPATQTANNAVFLRNDNSWQTVTPANIGAYTKTEIDSKVSTLNTAINGKAASSHSHDGRYYTEAEVDAKFDAIIGEGASTTLDTIGEISAAIEDNQDMLDTLNSAIGTKAAASDLTSHTGNRSNPHSVTASQVGAYTKAEVDSKLSGKADSGHTHTVDSALSGTSTNPVQNKVVKSALDGKANASHGNHVPATQTADNTKFLRNDNTWQSVTPANIGAYTKAEIDSKVSTLNTAINGKAASSHTHSAYVNQNAFSNVKVGTTTVAADSATDTLELAGSNVTITPDATNDKVTIGITKANVTSALGYTPPTTNTTYNAATTSAAGLMSAADKSKLDGIAANANNYTYTLPAAGSSLGGVKSGGDVTISSGTITVNDDSHNHVISNVDGLQSALDGKAASSHTHNYAGSSSAGGAATSANKLATARTISLTGDVTGSTSFDGSGNVSITATVADDSHNHTIANVDGLQSALNAKATSDHKHYAQEITVAGTNLNDYMDAGVYTFAQAYAPVNVPAGTNGWLVVMPWNENGGTVKQLWFRHGTSGTNDHETYVRTKISNVDTWSPWSKYYTTSNPPTAAEVGATPSFTNDAGGVEYSYGSGSGKNVLTEISNMPQGFHTIYAIAGTTGNPETSESYRYFIHKTSTTIGWIYAFGADGSIYSNYLAGANTYKGWRTIHDAKRKPLWSGARYMTAGHTITPSKKLSQCEHGWMLLWSDYDPDTSTINNTDFCTTMIPNRNWAGSTWNGSSYYCDIPRYSAGTATDSESRVIKLLTVYDDKLVGHDNNNAAPRNDVVLRAIFEF